MATAAGGKKPTSKTGGSSSDFYIPAVPVVVAPPRQSLGEDMMGWVAAVVLVGLLLPLLGFLYVDILVAKTEVKAQVEKVERLRQKLEQKEREK
jgi:hypothetical protein